MQTRVVQKLLNENSLISSGALDLHPRLTSEEEEHGTALVAPSSAPPLTLDSWPLVPPWTFVPPPDEIGPQDGSLMP